MLSVESTNVPNIPAGIKSWRISQELPRIACSDLIRLKTGQKAKTVAQLASVLTVSSLHRSQRTCSAWGSMCNSAAGLHMLLAHLWTWTTTYYHS